jgi:hypothetical protein
MTINKTSGDPLSFQNDIEAEFGSNPGRSLGQYRRDDPSGNFDNASPTGSSLSGLPLDAGIPVSGEIKFSDFYGKQLNMIVDYFNDTGSSGGEASNILNREDNGANTMAATWRYNNQSARVKVVGGYRSRPTGTLNGYNLSSSSWDGGKKVFINVNKQIGGGKSTATGNTAQQNDRRKVALRTGGWPSGTTLHIDIGSSGRLQGAGGNGKKGETNSGTPGRAFPGTAALGVEYPAVIDNNGTIRCGYGGGGGGAGSWSDPNKNPRDFGRSGGGGGGGAGIPVGFGGPENAGGYGNCGKGKDLSDQAGRGKAGGDATFDAGGNGGDGGNHGEGGGEAGDGGNGGDRNDASTSGSAGSPNRGAGGQPGYNGYGIVFSSSSIQSNSSGDKTLASADGGVNVGNVI